ncbi:MAG: 6,7-dimethyl-8-ribityllumazine synthase [Proteobacteria bacterium]|nr:MAG: 6,7-dimethyl-8-ribityllumazine synthase [Pseudomonadota bacterium]
MRFAIVVSKFNEDVTGGLLEGALRYLESKKTKTTEKDVYLAPGAFELPLLAKALAKKKKYDGVICLGCVIKGDTMHFEFISLAATMGILQTSLESEKPITFGVLTTITEEQAVARSRKNAENKGIEAAAACWETATSLKEIGK